MEGYINLLSPVKTSNSSHINYLDFKLQTSSTDTVRAVCYSPEKRKSLVNASQIKSPVQIRGAKRKHNAAEYTIRKTAKIAAVDSKNVEFPFNESCANNFKTVKESLTANIYNTVDLKVNILSSH